MSSKREKKICTLIHKRRYLLIVIADGHYENVSCINFDYEKGFEQVVRHVIEFHKVKHPHMVAGQPDIPRTFCLLPFATG